MSLTPGVPTFDDQKGLSVIVVNVNAEGIYFDVVDFMYNIETLPRAAVVTSLSLAPGDTDITGVPRLTATATIELYTTDTSAGPGSVPGVTAGGGAVSRAARRPRPPDPHHRRRRGRRAPCRPHPGECPRRRGEPTGAGDEPSDGCAVPPPVTETPTPTPTVTGPGGAAGRDPFSLPAIFGAAQTGSGTGTSTGTGTGTGTSTSTSTNTNTGSGSSTTGPPPTQPGNGSSTTIGGHEVVLIDVFLVDGVDTVQVEVDGTVYDVSEGETFGPNGRFELLSASGNCAAFLFADDSFTLCLNPQK